MGVGEQKTETDSEQKSGEAVRRWLWSTLLGKNQVMQTESDEIRQYLDDRKREAVTIDPQTAEVEWWYAETLDPYGVHDLPPQQVGREYFARHPGSEIWVWFGDLPDVTSTKLMELHGRKLAFPAGLQERPARQGPRE